MLGGAVGPPGATFTRSLQEARFLPVSDTKTQTAAKMMTELKVSGHLMTLDTGLFCVFNAPGGPLPDAQSGLPGVRLSLPPGPMSRPDVVTITTFRDDGWISGWNGAALVRVLRGPAQVMVTIHQAQNATGDAPKLQVLKLADAASLPAVGVAQQGAARPVAAPAAGAPAAAPPARAAAAAPVAADAEIVAHVAGRGDVGTSLADTMGIVGSKQWVEGFAITPRALIGSADIEYQAVLGRGWLSPWAEGGQFCGSRGMSLPILGLRVRLRGEAAEHFDCALQASFVDGTQVGPIETGDPAQADSLAPLESFKVSITPRVALKMASAPVAAKAAAKLTPAKVAPAKAVPTKAGPAKVVAKAPAKTAAKPAPKPAPGKGRK